jgi:biotin-dependent carboxylase-like uncharacterized protein
MLDVVRAGPLTTVQDLGRPGYAHLGVPRSGALDQPALRAANRLVGNAEGAAGLEITITGCVVRPRSAVVVAVTGGYATLKVDGQQRDYGVPHQIAAGATVHIGRTTAGVRTYLAVSGGIAVPPVLGSRSTDTLSGLGPAPLRDGDVVPLGTVHGGPSDVDVPVLSSTVLRYRPGPRDDWFADALDGRSYTVSPVSNRVGTRLSGQSLTRARDGELPSEGIVLGAIQVPADGQPLVFLADHPTTGGYPVIGVVHPDDLPILAQARPGATVTFHGPER